MNQSEKEKRDSSEIKKQMKKEKDYLLEITKLNNELLNTQRELHKKNQQLNQTVEKLERALNEIDLLVGLLPICAHCKKIKDSEGYWHNVETYISTRTGVQFSHGLCNDCAHILYPEMFEDENDDSE